MSLADLKTYLKSEFNVAFTDESLLIEALTQRNFLNEHPDDPSGDYQRLEFLGDSVMQIMTAEYLFKRYPKWHEGQLTEMRIAMVQSKSLAHFSSKVKLDTAVRLGKGEEMNGARSRTSLLEDIWEAFVGALYLDQGADVVRDFLGKTIFAALDTDFFDQFIDYKSRLQEKLQQNGAVVISYTTLNEHTRANADEPFVVEVAVEGHTLASGTGRSIKDAEKAAARLALQNL